MFTPFSAAGPADPASDNAGEMIAYLQRSEIFRDYQQAFEVISGLPLALRQAGSFQPPLHGSKRLNPFCSMMSRNNKSCSACLQLQQRVEDEATLAPKTLECFAGLSESAVPVRVGNKLVGYLQTGQIFLRAPSKARFKRVMRAFGGPVAESEMQELKVAYFNTRVVPKQSHDSIIRLLVIFARHLAAVSNQVMITEATAEPPAITKARAFIAEHQTEDMHLQDVARAAHMSAFYFCKLFKSSTGLTFTDYLGRLRIESVKQRLLNVQTQVAEVAYAAGFQSLSQFNRVFRRVTGESPSVFRHRRLGHFRPLVPASA